MLCSTDIVASMFFYDIIYHLMPLPGIEPMAELNYHYLLRMLNRLSYTGVISLNGSQDAELILKGFEVGSQVERVQLNNVNESMSLAAQYEISKSWLEMLRD